MNADTATPEPPRPSLGHQRIPRPSRSQVVTLAVTAAGCVSLYYLLPLSIGELERRMLCIFVVAAVFWAREVLPLFATSLLVISLMILTLASDGGLADVLPGRGEIPASSDISAGAFLASFGSNIIMLFLGGFLLSRALTKHGIDQAIAARVLAPFTASPLLLIYGVLGISAFASMWMSNTATAAMMLAIIQPILKQLPNQQRYARGLILAVPFGANVGGIGTPIGSPPNAVAFAAINASDYSVSFLQWMMFGLPLAAIMLLLVGLLLYRTHRPQGDLKLPDTPSPGKISWYGKLTLGILLTAVALWLTGQWHGIGAGIVALLAAASLTAFSVLDRDDVDSIDWNILILMWGGLAMGTGMEVSGLTETIGQSDLSTLPGGAFVLAAVVIAGSIVLSTFMSNTATSNLLLPIVMALSIAGQQRVYLAVLCALSCSFAMAMPVSTPPNAIAFATGQIKAGTLFWLGGLISLISGVVLLLGYRLVLPVVF